MQLILLCFKTFKLTEVWMTEADIPMVDPKAIEVHWHS